MLAVQEPVLDDRRRASQPLQAFVRDLHERLADWLPTALDDAAEALERACRTSSSGDERRLQAELFVRVKASRQEWLWSLADAIGHAVDEELQGAVRPVVAASVSLLSLLDVDEIDEDIAVSRLVQVAELEAEGTLRELAARCSSLRGLPAVSTDAHPMRPAVVARGLRRAAADFGLDSRHRLELLRRLAPAIGSALARVYARQAALLAEWDVQPKSFVAPGGRAGLPYGDDGADEGPLCTAIIRRPPGSEVPLAQAEAALRRLMPSFSGAAAAADGPSPSELMARLLAAVLGRAGLGEGTRTLIRRLEAPARRLAETEPELWRSAEHPLWQLLDRLISAGSVLEDIDFTRAGRSGAELEAAVTRLEQADAPDGAQLLTALDAMDGAATRLLDAEAERLAPQAVAMQAALAREEIETRVREQVLQHLRGEQVPPALHQFLVGPWTAALAHSAHKHGSDSASFNLQARMIETLVEVCSRPRQRTLATDVFTRCMTHARLGLADAGMPEARIEAELTDLGRVLRHPWVEAGEASASDAAEPGARPVHGRQAAGADHPVGHGGEAADAGGDTSAGEAVDLHDELATVQIDVGPDPQAAARAQAAHEAWLGSLEPGTLCRLLLQGRWTNTQLVWRSLDRSMFVFGGRQAGVTQSMARATLHKLRAAGMAATIERGQFIAQALGALARAAD